MNIRGLQTRRLSALVVAIGLAFVGAACGGGGSGPTAEETASPQPATASTDSVTATPEAAPEPDPRVDVTTNLRLADLKVRVAVYCLDTLEGKPGCRAASGASTPSRQPSSE